MSRRNMQKSDEEKKNVNAQKLLMIYWEMSYTNKEQVKKKLKEIKNIKHIKI